MQKITDDGKYKSEKDHDLTVKLDSTSVQSYRKAASKAKRIFILAWLLILK